MDAKAAVKRGMRRAGLGGTVTTIEENWPSKVGRRERRDNRHAVVALAARLRPESDCIDVGAHQGGFLQHMVRLAPQGRHLAFEPIPALNADLRARYPDVEVRQAALSDQPGTAEFFHATEAAGMSGLRSRPDAPDVVGERLEVQLEVLDEVVGDRAPVIVKIDVEGAELQVLRGAERTLREHRPMVLLEHGLAAASAYGTSSGDVHDVFASAGLRVFDLDGGGPYDRAEFEQLTATGPYWNWLAC